MTWSKDLFLKVVPFKDKRETSKLNIFLFKIGCDLTHEVKALIQLHTQETNKLACLM